MRTATRVFETKPLLSTATEVVGASCRVGWLGELHVESSSTREIKRERERERERESQAHEGFFFKMPRITIDLIRRKAEHNEGLIHTLEELSLHQVSCRRVREGGRFKG